MVFFPFARILNKGSQSKIADLNVHIRIQE